MMETRDTTCFGPKAELLAQFARENAVLRTALLRSLA